MEKVVLKAAKRAVLGKQVGALRRAGKLPAVLYGHHVESTPITLDAHATSLTLSHLTSSTLVTINLEGQEYTTLVRDRQRDPIKNRLVHLDFQALSLSERIRAKVGIELTGEAPAVKNFDATILHGLTEIEVESLPKDLPERIVVDISSLAEPGDSIHVRDVVLPGKVEILTDPEEVIASTAAARVEGLVEEAPVEEEKPAPAMVAKAKEEEAPRD